MAPPRTIRRLTASGPGGVAVLEARGPGVEGLVDRPPAPGSAPVVRVLPGGDRGLVVSLAPDRLLLMPHGGPAIVARLLEAVGTAGWRAEPDEPPADAGLPPPAAPADPQALEAAVARALARARSPRATDLLLVQPDRWRRHGPPGPADRARSRRLDRLVTPPLVVLAGPPGVGKSSLLNALAGRETAVVDAAEGTTRDPVTATVDLDGLVVRWADTAGLGDAADAIDRAAAARTRERIAEADLLVSAGDLHRPPAAAPAGRPVDLRLGLRADLGEAAGADLAVSLRPPRGLGPLRRRLRGLLVPDEDLSADRPWDFPEAPRTGSEATDRPD